MKKLLIIFIFIGCILNAKVSYELKLYENVLSSIFTQRPIKVFTDEELKELLSNSDIFEIVNDCNKSVVVIVGKYLSKDIARCKNKPIFSTNYKNYKNIKNSFGAFYWRKGRPQIRFKSDVVKKYNLNLPNSLQKYVH